jgi:hypothetical protein
VRALYFAYDTVFDHRCRDLQTISMEARGVQLKLRSGDQGPFLPITSDVRSASA